MKTLENKEIELQGGADETMDYAFFIRQILKTPKQGGLNYNQVVTQLKIEDALDESNGEIELEDAEAASLLALVNAHQWGIAHRDIPKFVEDVREQLK